MVKNQPSKPTFNIALWPKWTQSSTVLETKFQPFRLRNDKDIYCPKNNVLSRKRCLWLYIVWLSEKYSFPWLFVWIGKLLKQLLCVQMIFSLVQSWTSFSGQDIVFGTVDIFVIFQPKWLKFGFGLQRPSHVLWGTFGQLGAFDFGQWRGLLDNWGSFGQSYVVQGSQPAF